VGFGTQSIGAGGDRYTVHGDVNADGRIDVRDLAEVRRRVGTSLPDEDPAAAVQWSAHLRTRPVARSLFGSAHILA
jgi:hypothetical protein